MKKETYRIVVPVVALVVLLALIKAFQIWRAISSHASFQLPPEAVTSFVAVEEEWAETEEAVASIVATQGATLAAEEPGKVVKVLFESGAQVTQGQTLVELDTSVEEANLSGAVAEAEQAKLALARAQALRAKGAASEADLEKAVAQAKQAQASAESIKAVLAKKKISAPFSGTTGIRQVNIGQYLTVGTPIVPLFSLDPIFVNFSLPQQALQRLSKGQPAKIMVDAFPDKAFEGKINAINPDIDPNTRAVSAQAIAANPQGLLRPGMFAKVVVELGVKLKTIAIPASSVSYAPYGDAVYVIEKTKGEDGTEHSTVRQQIVHVGRKQGDMVAISSGLKPGDEVVSSGTFKLRPQAAVVVNNEIKPDSEHSPKPADS